MARFVVFNGIVRYKPGGITKINAEALNQVRLSDNSIVAVIGEADGGAPGAVSGLVTHFDPSRATADYRSGPLVDAIRLAFQASNDPDVPGGASRVLIYKTNQSTPASGSLPTEEATFVIGSLTPNDAEATGGSATTLVDSTLTGSFADDELNGKFVVLRPFTATAEVKVITDYVDATGTITVGSAWAVNPSALDDYWVLDAEVYDVSDVTSPGGTTVTWANGGLVVDAHIGRWLFIQNSNAAADYYLVRITDNTATTLTVTPALPALATGAIAQILPNAVDLTTRDYGAHTNNVNVDLDDGTQIANSLVVAAEFEDSEENSPEVGGAVFLKLLYRGGAAAISDTVDATPVVPNTAGSIELTTGALTPSAHVGTQVYSVELDEYSTITANTASVLTISPPFSQVPTAGTGIEIRTVTRGEASIAGAAGVATDLTTLITGVTGDNLAIPFTAGMTLRQLQTAINENTNYVATIPSGVNGDVIVAADFDFGPNTLRSILNSANITTDGFRQDNVALVNYFETTSELLTAVRSSGGALDGCCPPNATVEPVFLSGGTRGVSADSDFQDGFDALLLVRANSVVPLVDEDLVNEGFGSTATFGAVSAQLGAHVAAARGVAQNTAGERGGFIGFRGTKTEIIAQANNLNDLDVALVGQNPTTLNASGSLQEFGPRMLAVMAASMRAGVSEVAEPLTHKFLRTSGITQDASWDPADITDANELIIGGVLFAESIDGLGTRWVRDLTTHVQDDNLAFTEGSVRDAVRFTAYGLRTMLVNKFTGKKAAPATAESAKDASASYLELLRGQNIIVDSTDPATGATIRAYHNLKVIINGDILKVNVGIFPVPGINFTLNEIFLQLPTQAA
jgi:hypothetical protein